MASLSLVSPAGIGSRNTGFLIKAGLLSLLGAWGLRKSVTLVAGRDDVPQPLMVYMTTVFRNFRPRRQRPPIRTDRELAALAMPVQVLCRDDCAGLCAICGENLNRAGPAHAHEREPDPRYAALRELKLD